MTNVNTKKQRYECTGRRMKTVTKKSYKQHTMKQMYCALHRWLKSTKRAHTLADNVRT